MAPQEPQRPDPDALLAQVQREEASRHRGRLKIFFGMAPGVGKTYAMLQAGQQRRSEGVDVVVGIVETHRRADTAALLQDLEQLPRREELYRGHTLYEFDLDAALRRRPSLLLIDELAHTNLAGSRHAKRWQDVEEVLDAGIDVYTTVNVQHLESVNDLVGQVTGIRVQETFPDRVFEEAGEVELIDLPPDELLTRLADGKVYLGEQAERASANFFRKGNLIALRELALRRLADRVDSDMRDYRDAQGIRKVWAVGERLLVGIGADADAETLVRAGKRLASALDAEWIVAYVETPKTENLPKEDRERVLKTLALAEKLGAQTVTLAGPLISAELLGLAQTRNVSKLLVGKPRTPAWRRWLFGSAVDTLVRHARNIDVFIIGAEGIHPQGDKASRHLLTHSPAYASLAGAERARRLRQRTGAGVLVTLVTAVIAGLMESHFADANQVMVLLLGVVLTAVRYGRLPAAVSAVLSVAAFDFFCVEPRFTFAVGDTQYLLTFAVMLVVAITIARLASGLRLQAQIAGFRERRIAELFAMSRELTALQDSDGIRACAMRHVNEVFAALSLVLLPDGDGRIRYPERLEGPKLHVPEAELGVAQWSYDHGEKAGRSTDTLPGSDALFLPLTAASGTVGVLAIRPKDWERLRNPEQMRQLETFASQIAQALERVRLAQTAESARVHVESERLRNSLLAAISHDLRTPLATIVGAASHLAQDSDGANRALADAIVDEAGRMTELIAKVLDMARLEAGGLQLTRDWLSLEEIVGAILAGLKERRREHSLEIRLAPDLGLIEADPILLERVLSNLLENALKYTPPGSHIRIIAQRRPDDILVSVSDNGPGLPPGQEEAVFDKFYRVNPESRSPGVGLGLTICRAIVEAHGGRIWAEANPAGGVSFRFTLPQSAPAPRAPEF